MNKYCGDDLTIIRLPQRIAIVVGLNIHLIYGSNEWKECGIIESQ